MSTQKSSQHNLRGQFYLLLFDKMTIKIKFFTLIRMVKLKITVFRDLPIHYGAVSQGGAILGIHKRRLHVICKKKGKNTLLQSWSVDLLYLLRMQL